MEKETDKDKAIRWAKENYGKPNHKEWREESKKLIFVAYKSERYAESVVRNIEKMYFERNKFK